MSALTDNRNTPRTNGYTHMSRDLAPSTTIHAGSLVGQTSTGLAGMPTSVAIDRGVFRYGNSTSADAITLGDYGQPAYAVDDQTVAKTNGGGVRPQAGVIRNVDAAGVWIEL